MDKHTISFRLDAQQLDALDSLAEAMDRDRSYLLNEAVAAYLDIHQWHLRQINESLRQVEAGETVDHNKVKKTVSNWRKR